MYTDKDERVSRQEQIQDPVDEAHVNGQQKNNGLGKQQAQRARKVLLHQLKKVDFDFLLLGVDAPVLSAASQIGSLADEDDGRIRLLEEQEVENKGSESHDGGEVLGPAPAEVGCHYEATNKGGQQRTGKDGHGEEGNGNASRFIVKHVGEDCGDDGKRAGTKEAGEEAAYENGLNVLAGGAGNGEEREAKHGNDERQTTALELRKRRPKSRPKSKAQDVKGGSEEAYFGANVIYVCDNRGCGREDGRGKGRGHGGVSQHGSGQDLLAQRPILRMQGVVGPVKLDNVFFLRGQGRGIRLASTKGGQRMTRSPARSSASDAAATDSVDMLTSSGGYTAQGGRMAFEIVLRRYMAQVTAKGIASGRSSRDGRGRQDSFDFVTSSTLVVVWRRPTLGSDQLAVNFVHCHAGCLDCVLRFPEWPPRGNREEVEETRNLAR